MQHDIELAGNVDVVRHVVVDERETTATGQVGNVIDATGAKVVHGDYLVALIEKSIAQVRADETSPAGDENAHRPSARQDYPSAVVHPDDWTSSTLLDREAQIVKQLAHVEVVV
jgi:hypothetical protein